MSSEDRILMFEINEKINLLMDKIEGMLCDTNT